jgi:hypothetical protein
MRALRDRLFDETSVPAAVLQYPGMTSRTEKAILYNLARHYYRGEGHIVDVGIFLGASTNAFAEGLRDNQDALSKIQPGTKPIRSFDIAIWLKAFNRHLKHDGVAKVLGPDVSLEEGESFAPILEKLLANHLDLIDFRIGDIVQTAKADGPVEIAFYDCLKNRSRDWAAFCAFTPSFIPGRTIVIQQDYFYWSAYDNKVRQECLAAYFEYIGAAGASAVFRLIKPIPEEFYNEDPTLGLTLADKLNLLQQAAERTDSTRHRAYTEISCVALLLASKKTARAREQLDDIASRYADIASPGSRLDAEIGRLREKIAAQERRGSVTQPVS